MLYTDMLIVEYGIRIEEPIIVVSVRALISFGARIWTCCSRCLLASDELFIAEMDAGAPDVAAGFAAYASPLGPTNHGFSLYVDARAADIKTKVNAGPGRGALSAMKAVLSSGLCLQGEGGGGTDGEKSKCESHVDAMLEE